MRKVAKQLKLPLPRPSKADRKAFILDRLDGYAFRQAAREAKRREAAREKVKRGSEMPPSPKPLQLDIPGDMVGLASSSGPTQPLAPEAE